MENRIIIGRLENIDLPEFGIFQMPVRIDSGAQTSSLHVDNVERITISGKPAVAFDLHPELHNVAAKVRCQAVIKDQRKIKSSNGVREQRFVIITRAKLGDLSWPIEITLTDRSDMTYLMLLGRQAMGEKFYIDPAAVFLTSCD
ncbi:ATP-dependent zinc protease [Pseudoalteromonas sp. SSM20]|uniref:ATP-dependent zinc protease family protein n=1 Tax=Pseudoalteromonas sp. SSM20 TaxID=3139394 RepID=UPI003BAA6567